MQVYANIRGAGRFPLAHGIQRLAQDIGVEASTEALVRRHHDKADALDTAALVRPRKAWRYYGHIGLGKIRRQATIFSL